MFKEEDYQEGTSNCCDSRILNNGMCSQCLEHCVAIPEEEEICEIHKLKLDKNTGCPECFYLKERKAMEITERERELIRKAVHEYENTHYMEMDDFDQETINKLITTL